MLGGGFTRFGSTSPVVKNLIYINVIVLLISSYIDSRYNGWATYNLALFYPDSPFFQKYQFVTHMFMHGGFMHLFFNMFALWMFGKVLESVWGSKRFLFYYLVTGLGAAAFYTFVNYLNFSPVEHAINAFISNPSPDQYGYILNKYFGGTDAKATDLLNTWVSDPNNSTFISAAIDQLKLDYIRLVSTPTVGASGAVFGILLAFGMLFPNTQLMLLFPPIPIKAKWFVIGYGALELYMGLTQKNTNIAHFAHLGGMLFGFILIKYWNTRRTNFY